MKSLTMVLGVLLLVCSGKVDANGALALDSNQGSAHGFAINQPTMADAEYFALQECGYNCSIVARFPTGCAAYAADQTRGSTVYGYAFARSADAAKSKAVGFCAREGGSRCRVRVWACNAR